MDILILLDHLQKYERDTTRIFYGKNKCCHWNSYVWCQDGETLLSMTTKKEKVVIILSNMDNSDTVEQDTKKTKYSNTRL